ncbi:hypothetical protein E0Z10_g1527 [Xylaria hypoxylon]|uniref:Uncharacterized protein n=1 Tax=Xylaria hypoxylon TaxID=37992 RepID=A0A4Z0Z4S7_9PEZI|nr:hypothetical protein E0Z10_g1527 [Xylaria hypoxylon]
MITRRTRRKHQQYRLKLDQEANPQGRRSRGNRYIADPVQWLINVPLQIFQHPAKSSNIVPVPTVAHNSSVHQHATLTAIMNVTLTGVSQTVQLMKPHHTSRKSRKSRKSTGFTCTPIPLTTTVSLWLITAQPAMDMASLLIQLVTRRSFLRPQPCEIS